MRTVRRTRRTAVIPSARILADKRHTTHNQLGIIVCTIFGKVQDALAAEYRVSIGRADGLNPFRNAGGGVELVNAGAHPDVRVAGHMVHIFKGKRRDKVVVLPHDTTECVVNFDTLGCVTHDRTRDGPQQAATFHMTRVYFAGVAQIPVVGIIVRRQLTSGTLKHVDLQLYIHTGYGRDVKNLSVI